MTGGIYLTPLGEQPDTAACDRLLPLLQEEQRRRVADMRSAAVREQTIIAHVLARYLACRFLAVPNSAFDFSVDELGKPYLRDYADFHFNLSHTGSAVAAAVSAHPVGVDIERIRPARLKVADRCFTHGELACLRENPALTDRRFFEIWTRKEAFLKHSGTGIRLPLTDIDTTDSELAARLRTVTAGDAVISICGAALPESPPVTQVPLRALLAYTWE